MEEKDDAIQRQAPLVFLYAFLIAHEHTPRHNELAPSSARFWDLALLHFLDCKHFLVLINSLLLCCLFIYFVAAWTSVMQGGIKQDGVSHTQVHRRGTGVRVGGCSVSPSLGGPRCPHV